MSSTCFEPEGWSSGRRLSIHLWYGTFYMLHLQQRLLLQFQQPSSWRWNFGFETCRRHKKLYFFLSPHVICGLRSPPSWAWQECNRLLRFGRPWGAVTLSRWCVSGDRGGCSARRGRLEGVITFEIFNINSCRRTLGRTVRKAWGWRGHTGLWFMLIVLMYRTKT